MDGISILVFIGLQILDLSCTAFVSFLFFEFIDPQKPDLRFYRFPLFRISCVIGFLNLGYRFLSAFKFPMCDLIIFQLRFDRSYVSFKRFLRSATFSICDFIDLLNLNFEVL